jgi:hypothetical protein
MTSPTGFAPASARARFVLPQDGRIEIQRESEVRWRMMLVMVSI